MGRSVVGPSIGQTSTGGEGDPTALHLLLTEHGKPHGWSDQLTQPAVKPANAQGVQDVRESEGPPVIGGIGPPAGVERPNLKGC